MSIVNQLHEEIKEWTCLACKGAKWVPLSDDPSVIGVAPCSRCNGTGKMVIPGNNASKTPPHWAAVNPGLADQYRAEAKACREALGFDPDSNEISPADLRSAIDSLKAKSGNH